MASKGGSGDFLMEKIPLVYKPNEEERALARLIVCSRAEGPSDAHLLLDMLGLLDVR